MSSRLRLADVQAVFRLLGELCECGDTPHSWMTHLLRQICPMTQATFAATGFEACDQSTVRARPSKRSVFYHIECRSTAKVRRASARIIQGMRDAAVRNPSKGKGIRQIESTVRLTDSGVTHVIFLCRNCDQPPFSPRTAMMVQLLHEELEHLWQRDQPEKQGALPPRLKQSLEMLLAGRSEKQIALAMGLSRHSVHDHVKRLHRHFGVNSRAELLAFCRPIDRFAPSLSFTPYPRQNHAKE